MYQEGHGNNNYYATLDLRMTHEVMKRTLGFMDTLYLRSKPDLGQLGFRFIFSKTLKFFVSDEA